MKTALKIVVAGLFAAGCTAAPAARDTREECHVGTYHLHDGSDVDIGAVDESKNLRWRRKDGTSGELTEQPDGSWTSTFGWTSRPDGKRVSFSECSKGEITFAGVSGGRLPLKITETRFQGD